MPSPSTPSAVSRAHPPPAGSPVAVLVVFACAGVLIAQAVSRMPSIRDDVGASMEQLGFALVGMGIGSVLAMPWTGRIVERWGSRVVVAAAVVVAATGWAVVSLVGSPEVLGLVLFCVGAPVGMWDVAMNVQGHHVEERRGRSLMPRFHGAYSGGMVVGALVGAGAARLGVGLGGQLPVLSVVVGLIALTALRWFVADDRAAAEAAEAAEAAQGATAPPGTAGGLDGPHEQPSAVPARRGITGLEVLIGVICLSTSIGEGAAGDWLALLLVDERHAAESIGAATFAAFNVTMMLGRFAGGPAIERFGRAGVLRASGLCAAAGVLLVCLVPSVGVAVVGGLLWGLGLATVFPATMSAAGEVPGRGPRAIGVVSSVGYGGFLLGAPSIGALTGQVGLDRALLLIAGFAVLIVLLAGFASPRRVARGGRVLVPGRSGGRERRPEASKPG